MLMPYAACSPLAKFRLARLSEEASIVPIAWCSRIGSTARVLVGPLAIPLLTDEYQCQQGCGQSKDDYSFQNALVDVELKVIVVAIAVAVIVRVGMSRHHILIFSPLLVQLCSVMGFFLLVIFDECRDPFLEGPMRS